MKVNIFVFLSLLNIISGCIDFSVNVKLSFFPYVCIKFHCVYMYHISFIHSSVDGQLDWFHCLAVANSAAVSMNMQVSLCLFL